MSFNPHTVPVPSHRHSYPASTGTEISRKYDSATICQMVCYSICHLYEMVTEAVTIRALILHQFHVLNPKFLFQVFLNCIFSNLPINNSAGFTKEQPESQNLKTSSHHQWEATTLKKIGTESLIYKRPRLPHSKTVLLPYPPSFRHTKAHYRFI